MALLLLLCACETAGRRIEVPFGAACSTAAECGPNQDCVNARCVQLEEQPPTVIVENNTTVTPIPDPLLIVAPFPTQFRSTVQTLMATRIDGTPVEVAWTASTGAIDANGNFTAPGAAVEVTISATAADGATGMLVVHVVEPTPPMVFTTNGDKVIGLSWQPVPGATSYSVERSQYAAGPFSPFGSELTATATADSGNYPYGSGYYYRVTAKNGGVISEPSAPVRGASVSGREICAIDAVADGVSVFDALQDGDYPPLRSTVSNPGLQEVRDTALDEIRGEIYVLQRNSAIAAFEVRVFNVDAAGNAAPLRKFTVSGTPAEPVAIAFDPNHDLVFVAHQSAELKVFNRDVSGSPSPLRSIVMASPVTAAVDLAFDPVRNHVVVATTGGTAATRTYAWNASGTTASVYAINVPTHGDLTVSSYIAVDPVSGDIYRQQYRKITPEPWDSCIWRYEHGTAPTLNATSLHCFPGMMADSLAVHHGTGDIVVTQWGDQFVAGTSTNDSGRIHVIHPDFSVTTIKGPNSAQLKEAVDVKVRQVNGEIIVVTRTGRAVQIYDRPTTTGDVDAPAKRTIQGPHGFGADRLAANLNHGELYVSTYQYPGVQIWNTAAMSLAGTATDGTKDAMRIFYDNARNELYVEHHGAVATETLELAVYARPTSNMLTSIRSIPIWSCCGDTYSYGLAMAFDKNEVLWRSYYGWFEIYDAITPQAVTPPTPLRHFNTGLGDYGDVSYHNGEVFVPDGSTVKVFDWNVQGTPTPDDPATIKRQFTVSRHAGGIAFDTRGTPSMFVPTANGIAALPINASGTPAPQRLIEGATTGLQIVTDVVLCK